MKYCSNCALPLICRVPEGDNRMRYICEGCDTIFYENPRIVAGAIAEMDGNILFCRRAIEPRRGLWTLPAGFLECGETIEACARRETMEEAGGRLSDCMPYCLANLPRFNQVYVMYRAGLLNRDFAVGEESLEVKLFSAAAIPWNSLAFTVMTRVLELYCEDRKNGRFPFREIEIELPHPEGPVQG